MTEDTQDYKINSEVLSLSDFRNLPCALPFCSDAYCAPTPEEVSNLIRLSGWSQREVALIAGVSHNEKGSTTVRKWKAKSGAEARAIPYAAWRQLLEVAGVVTVEDVKKELELT